MEQEKQVNEIDLKDIFSTVKRKRYFILRVTCIALLCGIVVALFVRKEYEATCVVAPQGSSGIKIGGSLGGLAAMAGINIGSLTSGGGNGMAVELYKNVFNNVNLQHELLQTPITLSKFDKNVTVYDYIILPEYKRFVWFNRLKARTVGYFAARKQRELMEQRRSMMERAGAEGAVDPGYVSLSELEQNAALALSNIVTLTVNTKDNSVKISATMPESVAAAQIAVAAEQLLQKYIIHYKTQKAEEYLAFVQGRFNEAEANYQNKRERLAKFQDANKSLSTAVAQARMTRLEEESLAAFDVYASLSSQLEQAKIAVKEDTPVFMVLEPVVAPTLPIGHGRSVLVLVFAAVGLFIALCIVVFKRAIVDVLQLEAVTAWYEKEDERFLPRLKKKK